MVQPMVTIEQGTLKGSIGVDLKGNSFFKFQGIPFAKPPLGELRFKAPVAPEKWAGVFDATREGQVCYHADPLQNGALAGGEDCLFVNVYTNSLPQDDDETLRPVLVWIHGGGFFFGSGNEDLYGPDFLISENVVVVTFNYRLGLLGFLSFEDPSLGIPGNAGLKDQVMALKWIQKNICKFGGAPSNVTIFGESAGAASVHLLILSPQSKNLFHRAIIQSGCALNPWVQSSKGCESLKRALAFEDADDKTIYDFLMNKSVEELFQIQSTLLNNLLPSEPKPLGFVVEPNLPGAFLAEEPIKLMLEGKFNQVPVMIGYTNAEGILFQLFRTDIEDFRKMIPFNFGYEFESTEAHKVAQKIKQFYFGNEDSDKKTAEQEVAMLSDCYFIYGIHVTVLSQLAVSKAPIYLYRMSVDTEMNFFKKHLKCTLPGASHLDDVGYLFKHRATPEIRPGSREDIAVKRFIKLWTNFAKFGNPTPDSKDSLLNVSWKPVTSPKLDFLSIGDELVLMTEPDSERMAFWKRLFTESPAGQQCNCPYLQK